MDALLALLTHAANLAVAPFRTLYRRGPAVHGYGFCQGRPYAELCAAFKDTSEALWHANEAYCVAIYQQHEDAFIVAVAVAVYALLLLTVYWRLCCARKNCPHPPVYYVNPQKHPPAPPWGIAARAHRGDGRDGPYAPAGPPQ